MGVRRAQYLDMKHPGHRHVAGIFQPAGYFARRIDAPNVFADDVASFGFVLQQRSRRKRAILHVARQLNRIEDLLIAGAAADVAAQPLLDLLTVCERICAQRSGRSHDHAGNAVTALAGARFVKGLLQDAEFAGFCQCLDRFNCRPLRFGDRQQTGLHQRTVDEDRAGAAFPGTATFLVAGQIEVVPDEIEQPLVRLGIAGDFATIDRCFELKVRHRPPPAQVRARPAARQRHALH